MRRGSAWGMEEEYLLEALDRLLKKRLNSPHASLGVPCYSMFHPATPRCIALPCPRQSHVRGRVNLPQSSIFPDFFPVSGRYGDSDRESEHNPLDLRVVTLARP